MTSVIKNRRNIRPSIVVNVCITPAHSHFKVRARAIVISVEFAVAFWFKIDVATFSVVVEARDIAIDVTSGLIIIAGDAASRYGRVDIAIAPAGVTIHAGDFSAVRVRSPISPLDPRALAKHLKIDIWRPADVPGLDSKTIHHLTVVASDAWSAATLRHSNTNLIIINDSHPLTRQNNSLAHEIGHVVLRHEPAKMYVTPDGLMMMSEYVPAQEEEATWFAGAILVPRDALLDLVKRGISDTSAASHFGVSVSLLRMRRSLTGIDIQLSRRRGTWAP